MDFSLANITAAELLDALPLGVAVVDKDFRIIEMNRNLEAWTGFSCSKARGVLVDNILRSSLGSNYDVFRQVVQSGEPSSFEADIINKNNKKIQIQCTLSPLKDRSGQLAGITVALEDISYLHTVDAKLSPFDRSPEIIGHSLKMQEIFELMPVLAHTDASILITGQTGTGKDMIAEAIHKGSKRSRYPFIKINCGALPEALLESELFGHVRGAFTGAVKDNPGMFRLAQNGTIFLTEIGDLPLPLQMKLLSVLDDKEFFPVGGNQKIEVDVRVIAATHHSLRKLVSEGKFREDLFYRLNVLRLYLPPLKEREGDVVLLIDHFFREFNRSLNKNIKEFSSKCISILTSYNYPGNVRELRNIVEYAVNICQGKQIKTEHLPAYMFSPVDAARKTAPIEKAELHSGLGESEIKKEIETGKVSGWKETEKEMIMAALKQARGNRSEAAKALGLGRTTLWRKINRYGLA